MTTVSDRMRLTSACAAPRRPDTWRKAASKALAALVLLAATQLWAGRIYIPNASFESPLAPRELPFAGPALDSWQKSPQPGWFNPAELGPWEYQAGVFYNAPFPETFLTNCQGSQAAFLFANPDVAIFQDYKSLDGTNTTPSHAFNARYQVGRSYYLTVGVVGGKGGMRPEATLSISLYYRDASSNQVQVASVTVTNDPTVFANPTAFVDFQVRTPAVRSHDAWAGQNIGIQLASTAPLEFRGGYWDVDNVRLVEAIDIPNGSFETPVVPAEPPFATNQVDFWQKTPQPAWYDPAQNYDTPWDYLMGTFYNAPNPSTFIDNCDGSQAAFLFALPGVGIFQDPHSPGNGFDASFTAGKAYTLTAGVLGGGGGMLPGATMLLSLYYLDDLSQKVTLASAAITNSTDVFPTNTHLVYYQVQLPGVRSTDPWAGRKIGIALLSTVADTNLARGYWDVDNVRLEETVAPALANVGVMGNQVNLTLLSEPDAAFELQSATHLPPATGGWTQLATVTNLTGADVVPTVATNGGPTFYRLRQL